MKKLSLRDRYFRYYTTALGYSPTPARTTKYIVLKSPDGARYVFLGAGGAVRTGTTPYASASYSLIHPAPKARLSRWEQEHGL